MTISHATTQYGAVTGVLENGYTVFRGIPYAAPPVGKRRFSAPQPPVPWNGERACTQWPPDAYRFPFRDQNMDGVKPTPPHAYAEDCLYLNVWTPAESAGEKLPVMVWLYGAGGCSHDPYVDGAEICRRGCILVTFNYRIGVFGFFGLKELAEKDEHTSTGTYGIQDILFALRWVRANIAAFGGDPDCVTVFGHSAGAIYTKLLLCAAPAWGLFHRVISLSGGGTWDIDYIHSFESKCSLCRELIDRVGWTVEDLMTRPAREICEVLCREELALERPKKSMLNTLFLPSVDHWLVHDYYGKLLNDGPVDASVDVMCGMLSEEWHNVPCQVPGGIQGYEREFALGPVIAWGRRYCERGFKPLYNYFFERCMPGDGRKMRHGDELPYVFGTLDRYDVAWREEDYELSKAMLDYFTNFAKTGDPNGSGLARWEAYTTDSQQTMHISDAGIRSENIADYEKATEVVNFLLEHPGMLNDPFSPTTSHQ